MTNDGDPPDPSDQRIDAIVASLSKHLSGPVARPIAKQPGRTDWRRPPRLRHTEAIVGQSLQIGPLPTQDPVRRQIGSGTHVLGRIRHLNARAILRTAGAMKVRQAPRLLYADAAHPLPVPSHAAVNTFNHRTDRSSGCPHQENGGFQRPGHRGALHSASSRSSPNPEADRPPQRQTADRSLKGSV